MCARPTVVVGAGGVGGAVPMTARGTLVTGTGRDGRPRATHLSCVADDEATMAAPFLELLVGHGSLHGIEERDPAAPLVLQR